MLADRVLVKPEVTASERQTAAGLVIPVSAQGPTQLAWAQVCAAGESVRAVGVGDRVLYDPVGRAEVDLNGQDYVLLREKDLHAVAQVGLEDDSTGLYL